MDVARRPRLSGHESAYQQFKAKAARLPHKTSMASLSSVASGSSVKSRTSALSQNTIASLSSIAPEYSKSRGPESAGGSDFCRFPPIVFDTILDRLRDLHSDDLSPSCATCYMRDLVALQLTNRSWDKAVRKKLYTQIQIGDQDSAVQLKKYKMGCGSRLKLLRRTLRERRVLARLVKDLTVPDPAIPTMLANGTPNPRYTEYQDLVASVVMICPNLERLQGFHTFYNHEFSRLTHALSTRRDLREHTWLLSENYAMTEQSYTQHSPARMNRAQIYQFLHHHSMWCNLETIMFCSPGGAGVLDHEVFVRVFQLLPRLKTLCVSCFGPTDFHDGTLFSLPNLASLRLEECPGVTPGGLARWAATTAAQSLQSLSLIRQNVKELLQISKVIGSLSTLRKFTILQPDTSPDVPGSLMVLQPIIASRTLQQLHWDVGLSGHFTSTKYFEDLPPSTRDISTANAHLAQSILHAGFPSLQMLRAPRDLDPPGVLQAACRPTPNGSILLPADRLCLGPSVDGAQHTIPESLPVNNTLNAARIRAQSYIDVVSRSQKDLFKIVVTDHSESVRSRHESSSTEYTVSTTGTDPEDLFSGAEDPRLDTSADRPLSISTPNNKEVSAAIMSILAASTSSNSKTKKVDINTSSTPAPKLHEYVCPPFLGRVSVSTSLFHSKTMTPPLFNLLPDVAEYDTDGGVIGWADFLRLREKDDRAVNGPAWLKDGCSGAWNSSCPGGPRWWKHTERERRAGTTIGTQHFF